MAGQHLSLVPCSHFYLEMRTANRRVISLCKFCRKRFEWTMEEWGHLVEAGRALNKPVRV